MKHKPIFIVFLVGFSLVLVSCSGSRANRKSDPLDAAAATRRAFAEEYSRKLGVPVPESANPMLMSGIYDWIGVPYKYGGNDKKGVDCSGFISNIFPLVYKINVPRVSAQMYKEAQAVEKKYLREGDLVFFKINSREVGHAGIFMFDEYFVHASTSKGVMISRLDEDYWRRYFVGGGRFSR